MENSKSNSKDKKIVYLILGSVSLLLVLIVTFIIILVTSINNNPDNIKIDGVDQKLIDEVSKQLVYTSSDKEQLYYSPELGLAFTLQSQKYSVSEASNNIYLYKKGANFMLSNLAIRLYVSDDEINKDNINDFVAAALFNPEDLVLGDIQEDDDILYLQANYSYTSFVDEQIIDANEYLLFKKLENNKTLVVVIKNIEESDKETFNDIITLMKSASSDVSKISKDLIVSLDNGFIKLKLDREKWELTSQSNSSATLSFKSVKFETDEKYKYSSTLFIINSYNSYNDDTIDKELDEDKKYFNETYKDKNPTLLKEGEEIEISGVEFKYNQYKYDGYKEEEYRYSVKYFGITSNSKMITISIYTDTLDSVGYKDTLELLNRIEIEGNISSKAKDETVAYNLPNVLGSSSIEIPKSTILAQPSVVQIFNRTCVDIEFESLSAFELLAGNNYNICGAGTGSGFYVSNEGYIVTNAHVATPNLYDVIYNGGYDPDGFFKDLYTQALYLYLLKFPNADMYSQQVQEQAYDIAFSIMMYSLEEGEASLDNPVYENYVQIDKPMSVDRNSLRLLNNKDFLKAEVIDYNKIVGQVEDMWAYMMKKPNEKQVPDLALIKVNYESTVPVLKLSDPESISSGSKINVIGFPGVARGTSLSDVSANTIPTITNGVISAIIPADGASHKLVQIDASVSGGNSGGPIINQDGEVVGVATYGVRSDSGNYNFGIFVEEVIKLLDENNVDNSTNELYTSINKGINYMSRNFYSWAIESFNEAIKLNDSTESLLNPLIKVSQAKIDSGDDESPLFEINGFYVRTIHIVLLVFAVFLSILIVILIIVRAIKINRQKKLAMG